MDNIRLILIAAFCVVSLLIWQAWQRDYGQIAAPWSTPAKPQAPEDIPAVEEGADDSGADLAAPTRAGSRVRVRTDVFDMEISNIGGVIERVELPAYSVSIDQPHEPFVFLEQSSKQTFVSQGGLRSTGPTPDHHAEYRAEHDSYTLASGASDLEVALTWGPEQGLSVRKVYTFKRGSYLVNLRYEIHNEGAEAWTGRMYNQLQRSHTDDSGGFIYTYTGAALSSPEKRYEKLPLDDMMEHPLDRDVTGGWAAIMQHYFVAAQIPDQSRISHYYSKVLESGKRYLIGLYGPEVRVPGGGNGSAGLDLYLGPKIQPVLEGIAPGLELTVDYGFLWFIGKPIFWALQQLHGLTGNWGWAIVLVTLILKLAFFQLSAASYKSMAKMKRLQPRITALRERFEDDKVKMNQAIMELYKEEKVNPFGGCLPILVQVPVFIALYWVLLESVELRQASFGFWIKDLSNPDPYFILPLLMGVSMLIQYRLNPTPIDPIQQKVMQMLPIIFTVFFAFFPSGLVLYWVANNVLSIAQQWVINRRFGEASQPAKA